MSKIKIQKTDARSLRVYDLVVLGNKIMSNPDQCDSSVLHLVLTLIKISFLKELSK